MNRSLTMRYVFVMMLFSFPAVGQIKESESPLVLDGTLQKAFHDLEQAWTIGDVAMIATYTDNDSRIIFTLGPNGPNGMYNSSHVLALLREKFKMCDRKMFKFIKYKNLNDNNASPYGVGRCQCLDNRSPDQEEIVYVSLRYNGQHPVIESIKTQTLSSTQPALSTRK
jgi:hypothetical protein